MNRSAITAEDIMNIESNLFDEYLPVAIWEQSTQKDALNFMFYTSGIHAMTKAVIAYLSNIDKEAGT